MRLERAGLNKKKANRLKYCPKEILFLNADAFGGAFWSSRDHRIGGPNPVPKFDAIPFLKKWKSRPGERSTTCADYRGKDRLGEKGRLPAQNQPHTCVVNDWV